MIGKAREAMNRLKLGNQRFRLGQLQHPHNDPTRRRDIWETGQEPFATVLTCADSRVPAELIFDQGLGDLFVIRNAGNILDTATLASLEYAASHLQTPLILILAHQDCGAVKATVSGKELSGHLKFVGEKIRPAMAACKGEVGDILVNTIKANAYCVIRELEEKSPIVKQAVDDNITRVVAAYYNMESGEVEFLS